MLTYDIKLQFGENLTSAQAHGMSGLDVPEARFTGRRETWRDVRGKHAK